MRYLAPQQGVAEILLEFCVITLAPEVPNERAVTSSVGKEFESSTKERTLSVGNAHEER